MTLPDNKDLPDRFRAYSWSDKRNKHALYGYPADTYPRFPWVKSLETRFAWLRDNSQIEKTSATNLIREMFDWGGSRQGEAAEFVDKLGMTNLLQLVSTTIENLGVPKEAILAAMDIPGMQLAYGSKFLRFLDPKNFGALDTRVCKTLKISTSGGATGLARAYVEFIEIARNTQRELTEADILRPKCALARDRDHAGWRIADVEMAWFSL